MSDVHQFSAHELDTLAAVLDQVIPASADGRLPGAGFLAHGERFGSVIRLLPGLDLGLVGGLAACDEAARKRGAADYVSLGDDDRLAVLNEVAAADGGFVPSHVYRCSPYGDWKMGTFDPATSDFDFMVDLGEQAPGAYADAWFGLRESLEALLGRPVDLVTEGSVTNPYLRADIERTRQRLYGA